MHISKKYFSISLLSRASCSAAKMTPCFVYFSSMLATESTMPNKSIITSTTEFETLEYSLFFHSGRQET